MIAEQQTCVLISRVRRVYAHHVLIPPHRAFVPDLYIPSSVHTYKGKDFGHKKTAAQKQEKVDNAVALYPCHWC